jgi:Protein of unknown function (DUF998)
MMSMVDRPVEPVHSGIERTDAPSMVQKVLLACGILAALLYAVSHDALAALLYRDYSPFSQTISELSSIGAPTRPAVTAVVLIHEALLIAFGIGVWRSAPNKRAAPRDGCPADRVRSHRPAVAAVPDHCTRGDRRSRRSG